MNQIRLVLALLIVSGSLVTNAQNRDDRDDRQDGVSGGICQVGNHCPPGFPGDGGHGNVDPSPYDPRPGRPDRPQRPDRPGRPDRPNQPDFPQYPHQPDRPNRPDYPDYTNSDRRDIYVNRRVQNEHLDLLRLAGLDSWSDRGAVIESVEVIAQPGAVQSALSLNADGFIVASQNYPSSYNTLRPNRHLVIGQGLSQLSLGVRGVLYIDRIIVNVRNGSGGGYPPPQPPPPAYGDVTAPGYVNQVFYSNTTLDLIRITNLRQYRGYRVTAVTVRGRSNSNGSARVVINGVVAGRVDLTYGGDTVRMPINAVVGQNLNSLNLQVVPTSQIDSVEVVLSRY